MAHEGNISATAREINVYRKLEWVKNEKITVTKKKQTKREEDFKTL